MCGIFGVVSFDPGSLSTSKWEEVRVEKTLDVLSHRGPDHRGVWSSPQVVFAHTRLAIRDLNPGANQPMVDHKRGLVLVFNGEIYNDEPLRKELVSLGHVFQTHSDTEVILVGFAEWGESVVQKLDGMFAFGLWDIRNQSLLLARDSLGKKPLFYAEEGMDDSHVERSSFQKPFRLWFASETGALFAGGLEKKMNPESLVSVFTFGSARAPLTMYKNVKQLSPGHVLLVTKKEAKLTELVKPAFLCGGIGKEGRRKMGVLGRGDIERELISLLKASVKKRLVSEVNVGAFLSGGVDSSLVVALMKDECEGDLHTFSLGFEDDKAFDETYYAKMVASHLRTQHHVTFIGPESFACLPDLVSVHDGPFIDSSAIATSLLCKMARDYVQVALTGDGGDELFAGYNRFIASQWSEAIPLSFRNGFAYAMDNIENRLEKWQKIRNFSEHSSWQKNRWRTWLLRVKKIHEQSAKAKRSLEDRMLSWVNPDAFSLHAVFQPDFCQHIDVDIGLKENSAIGLELDGRSSLRKALQYNFKTYLRDDLLLKVDRSSMLHSLELRSPMLDRDLSTYASTLPNCYLTRGKETKWLLKKVASQFVPKEAIYRKKYGFGLPLARWFCGPLKAMLKERLAPGAKLEQYVRRSHVDRVLHLLWSGEADTSLSIFTLLTLEIWLNQ